MKLEFLNKSKKSRIMRKINSEYGINKLNYLFLKTGKEKIRIYSGGLSREEIGKLQMVVNIEMIGMYFAKLEKDERIRLGMDSTILFRNSISKGIIEIKKSKIKEWMKGEGIETNIMNKEGFVIIKSDEDNFGVGKINKTGWVINFIPKERRIRSKNG